MKSLVYEKPKQLYGQNHFTIGEITLLKKTFDLSLSSADPEDPKRIDIRPENVYETLKGAFDSWWETHLRGAGRVNSKCHLARIFYCMYCIYLEDLPLYANEDEHILPVILWRLKISK
jgi:hypothetical protein